MKDCLQRCVTGMAGTFKKSQISRQLKAMGLKRNRLTQSQVTIFSTALQHQLLLGKQVTYYDTHHIAVASVVYCCLCCLVSVCNVLHCCLLLIVPQNAINRYLVFFSIKSGSKYCSVWIGVKITKRLQEPSLRELHEDHKEKALLHHTGSSSMGVSERPAFVSDTQFAAPSNVCGQQ